MKNKSRSPSPNEHPFQINDWKPLRAGTLEGFASIVLPTGVIVKGLQVHRHFERRWIAYPVRVTGSSLPDDSSRTLLAFTTRKNKRKFERHVLNELSRMSRRKSWESRRSHNAFRKGGQR